MGGGLIKACADNADTGREGLKNLGNLAGVILEHSLIYMCFKPPPILIIVGAELLEILLFFCCGVPFLTDKIQLGVWLVLLM